MSKLQIVNSELDTHVPFLRGVLTRSLQDTGLSFQEAYALATQIRDDLDHLEEINRDELRKKIITILEQEYPDAVLHRYRKDPYYQDSIIVRCDNDEQMPFSRGTHSSRLQICSLPRKKSAAITRLVHNKLLRERVRDITTEDLASLTYQVLQKESSDRIADNYLVWRDFKLSTKPLLVLIGGVPCSGKSTVATEVAAHLNIIRIQSTDMLREVMRSLVPETLAPVLHQSSFKAGDVLSPPSVITANKDEIMLDGFHRQAEMVEIAAESVLQRAYNERVSMVLEGVHVRASLLDKVQAYDAVVVPIMLGVLDKKQLRRHIKGRGGDSRQRRAERYHDNMDSIWKLQSMLLSESDAADIQVINNNNVAKTTRAVIETVVETIAARYKGTDKLKQLQAQHSNTNWQSKSLQSSIFDHQTIDAVDNMNTTNNNKDKKKLFQGMLRSLKQTFTGGYLAKKELKQENYNHIETDET